MKTRQTTELWAIRSPMALAAVAFAGGVWLADHAHPPTAFWGAAGAMLILCSIAAMGQPSRRLAHLSAVLALICAGAFTRVASPVSRLATPPPEFMSGEPVEIEGYVINDGALLPGNQPRERFDLQTEIIRLGDRRFMQPVGIRITVFSTERGDDPEALNLQLPLLAYGDRVRVTMRLRPPHNFGNPGTFDYTGYLRGLGISALASARPDKIERLPGRSGGRLGRWRSQIRHSILRHIADPNTGLWSHNDAALFAAMIVGEDSLLVRDVREEFQETGVYHLLVVSGMNVALLAFAVFWLARRLRISEWAASLVTIALSIFYAYVAGLGVPIQRAVLMLSVYLVARLLYRDRAAFNATGVAALAVLVAAPSALYEAGFQLTFLALLAISGIGVPLLERTSERWRHALQHLDSKSYDLTPEPRLAQFRLDLRMIGARLAAFTGTTVARWIIVGSARVAVVTYELLLVSSITQAVVVAPMRAYFHRAAIIGLPANVLVLPLAGTMLNSGVAAIALSYVSRPFAHLAAWIATVALHWTLHCLNWLSHLHITQWRIPDASWGITLAAAGSVAFAVFAVRRSRAMVCCGLAGLYAGAAVVAFYAAPPRIEPGKLEITAIDVGQGDSILIISPQGRAMLVDGGGSIGPVRGEFDVGEDVVSPYLWSRGLDKLDVVVLTHAHGDHIGGLKRIIENFRPRELWVGINPGNEPLDRLYAAAAARGVAVRKHVTGDAFDWGGARIQVLSPPADWQPKALPGNNDSLAFLVVYDHTSALLAGDLEKQMEKFVAAESPHADVLKVAHHGSATSTTPELLAAVQPRFAVISAGFRNSFGHPRPVVLERLKEAHVMTYRTDTQGAITFLLDGKSVEPHVVMAEQ